MGSLFKHLRDRTESKAPKGELIVSRDRTIFSNGSSCLDFCKENFALHLNRTTPSVVADEILCKSPSRAIEVGDLPTNPFNTSEIRNAMNRLKNNLASGIGFIISELLKYVFLFIL